MTVSLSQLRQVVNRLLDEVATRNGGDEVELTEDYYWVLDPGQVYDVDRSPTLEDTTLGQLSDDLEELAELASTDRPAVVWHDLSHAVGILQWLAIRGRP
jgi:hypothetical protein